jgi:hypothetical protein
MKQMKWMPLLLVCLLIAAVSAIADDFVPAPKVNDSARGPERASGSSINNSKADLDYAGAASFSGIQIATTYWDRQHQASVGRMIARVTDSLRPAGQEVNARRCRHLLPVPSLPGPVDVAARWSCSTNTQQRQRGGLSKSYRRGNRTKPADLKTIRLALDVIRLVGSLTATFGSNCSFITTGISENSYPAENRC